MIGVNLIKDMEQKSSGLSCPKMGHNVLRIADVANLEAQMFNLK